GRAHGAPRAEPGRAPAHRAAPHRRALRALPERVRPAPPGGPAMSKAYPDGEIWFLTGSQDLYGEETLAQVAAQAQEIARALDASADVPAKVVWKPVLKDSASIRRAALDANADDKCLGVIVWMHTFSPAKMWIAGLDALRTPMLHLHTQANVELPWS